MRTASVLWPTALVLLAACTKAVVEPPSTPPALPPPIPTTSAPAPLAVTKTPPFENPGGMWLPEQMTEHAKKLTELGLAFDPQLLSHPLDFPLDAIVSLGGCSASFVSAEGLIITNNHCASSALQNNTTPARDLLTNGFLAKSRAEELPNGPTARVYVTRAMTDVTAQMRQGLDREPNDRARKKAIEARQKALIKACESGKVGVRCGLAEELGGSLYRLIEYLEIRDVRVVFAPHRSVGSYGGDIDNWRWPRHSGDVAMFRAYVGKDGNPADPSPDNVPFKPKHHLVIAKDPLLAGDLVWVAGYPGSTSRLTTFAEVDAAVDYRFPHQIQMFEEFIDLLRNIGGQSPELKIKVAPNIAGLSNQLIKTRGLMEGMKKGGVAADKQRMEKDLQAFLDADPKRKAALGDVISKIAQHVDAKKQTREEDALLSETIRMVDLLGATLDIVRMAEERAKPDADREPDFQERNWPRLEQRQRALKTRYDRAIDTQALRLSMKRALRLKDRPALVDLVAGKGASSESAIGDAIDAIYAHTGLEDIERRVKLLREGKVEVLRKSTDPLMQLAMRVRPLQRATQDRSDAFDGALVMLRPRYVEALRAMHPGPIAPDADSTLRVTYGTVRGYAPTPESPVFKPFTTLSEMLAKNTSKPPFDVPQLLVDAAKDKRFGPYVDANLGEVPVDFLSDLDITGGNSGSATLNAKGELVGLVFDHNYESVASDWVFLPKITRSIHVDIRYVAWLLDAVYRGDSLLTELGLKPAVASSSEGPALK
jgi:hypothetical protein